MEQTLIRDLKHGMKNMNLVVIVLEIGFCFSYSLFLLLLLLLLIQMNELMKRQSKCYERRTRDSDSEGLRQKRFH
jgi:hypothetical protein